MATLSDPKPPSRVEALAHELEQMALRATARDHVESPIIHAIAAEPDPRPFEQALRTMVNTLAKAGAPEGSIVLRLIDDGDFDVAFKLDLLRTLVRANGVRWKRFSRDEREGHPTVPTGLLATVINVAVAGGVASAMPLQGWLQDSGGLEGGGSCTEIAEWLLVRLASDAPRAIMDAAAYFGPVLARITRPHPKEALAFVRDRLDAKEQGPAIYALFGIVHDGIPTEEAYDQAMRIAVDVDASYARGMAMGLLLRRPAVSPELWAAIRSLPASVREASIHYWLGNRAREGLVEPLAILEHWLHEPGLSPFFLSAICEGFRCTLRNFEEPCPLPMDVRKRILHDTREALRRGAHPFDASLVAEAAIGRARNVDYEAMGLEDLIAALLATEGGGRRALLYSASWPEVRATSWGKDLFERLTKAVTPEERAKWIGILEGHTHVETSQDAIEAVRAAGWVN